MFLKKLMTTSICHQHVLRYSRSTRSNRLEKLKKYKKNHSIGFEQFVLSLENKNHKVQTDILIKSYLEDPIYTQWAQLNLRGFDYFLELDSEALQLVIKHFPNTHILFLRALKNHVKEFEIIDQNFPHLLARQYRVDREVEVVTTFLQEEARLKLLDFVLDSKRNGLMKPFKFQYPVDDILNGLHFILPKDGNVSLFYENGNMAIQGEMKKNLRQGDWIAFYPDQTPCAEGTYHEGLQNGEWSYFYQSGDLKARGCFVKDEKHETWIESDLNGEILEVLYQNGKVLQTKKIAK